ncbi:eCIS core domain-containing protein [Sphingomonas nostoxanthinifaciens]|uniref:eCIS core domain-containing protein n=1 Tax=Sphingomonas nostoxanthinifaciens TaxID=2872652 RepID=UPI001CC2104B|nr:DUF4157 domain-containing protein [Sphingomonas nostoxanthinifaciens]UAK23294.1 DUF4157 domain-containing protein [Sphingomonas nostoxanthinifaciens]
MILLAERPKPVRAQRKAPGGGGPVTVPRPEGGRALDGPVRAQMEAGFGRDLGHVRIHDGPDAAQSAHEAGALAYTAGSDVVFGAGQYAPGTDAGTALLAHELAHTVQQAGVQHKADGPIADGADRALEAEADGAAAALLAGERVGPLTRVGAPALMRATPPAAGRSAKTAAGPTTGLPPGFALVKETPTGAGATEVVVNKASFTLPLPKGAGPWVKQAYANAGGAEGRLVFTTDNADQTSAAWKEEGSSGEYQRIWLGNLGFTSMKDLGSAIKTSTKAPVVKALQDAGVKAAVDGMEKDGLAGSGFDIDHIVEKQIGGTSIPTNLQLLPAKKNQDSGTQTYARIVELVQLIRDQRYRPNAKRVQIRFQQVAVPNDPEQDAGFKIETLLRAGHVKGSAEVKADAQAVPITLTAGGFGETVRIGPDETRIDAAARRVIPGMRLKTYKRGKGAKKSAVAIDHVAARLDSGAVKELPNDKDVSLTAEVDTAPAQPTSVGGLAKSEGAAAAASGETRRIAFAKPKPKQLGFYYPYLSPGALTSFEIASDGSISGEGVIHPTLKFLPDVQIRFGKDLLEAKAPLDAKKFRSPVPGINFVEGNLALTLADASGPKFQPSGHLKFTIGPAAKPIINGEFNAGAKDNKLYANGTLTPAQALPGIKDAKGEFAYDQDNGWSGKLTASSSKIPNATVDVALGFRQEGDKFVTYAEGGIKAGIRDKVIDLRASWAQAGLVYTGSLDWPKPFPIVDNVTLKGRYADDQLDLQGATTIHYRQWDGNVTVFYRQKSGEPGKMWGKGAVNVETKNKKAKGKVNVEIDDAGELTGQGNLSYALTDKITPELGVKLTKGGHLTISGSVKVADFELFKKWPEKGGERDLIKASPSFKIPTPIPAVNAAINIEAGVGIAYGVGPGRVTGVELSGQFDPLEENPNVTASLKGKFVVPTSFSLTGRISARIGAEVAGGAVGIDGGVTVRPSLGISADATVDIAANYEKGGFAFSGKAFIDVVPKAKLGVDLTATVYAAWHALEYQWNYPVAAFEYTLPGNIRVNVGEIGYSSAEGMRWPKLSDISIEPKDISPLKLMQDVMAGRKTSEKGKG